MHHYLTTKHFYMAQTWLISCPNGVLLFNRVAIDLFLRYTAVFTASAQNILSSPASNHAHWVLLTTARFTLSLIVYSLGVYVFVFWWIIALIILTLLNILNFSYVGFLQRFKFIEILEFWLKKNTNAIRMDCIKYFSASCLHG